MNTIRFVASVVVSALACVVIVGCATDLGEENEPGKVESASSGREARSLSCRVVKAVKIRASTSACSTCEVRVSGYSLASLVSNGAVYEVQPGSYDLSATGTRCSECLAPVLRAVKASGGSCW